MVLTPKGRVFLRNIDDALHLIRKAKAEASAGNVSEASYLRIGTISDFESDIIPEMAVFLSRQMPRCDFLFLTDTSISIIEQLRDRQLDLGVTTSPDERPSDLQDRPLMRDPFVVVLKAGAEDMLADIAKGDTPLPFLRFSANLMIARMIEAQLRRIGQSPAHRFECSNNLTLMSMVAAGAGWTITTPLLFARAKAFHPQLRMHPFPGKSFARTLSVVSTPDCSSSVVELINGQMRRLIQDRVITPSIEQVPWLSDSFKLID